MQRHVPSRPGLAIAGGILLLAMWSGGTLWGTDRGIRNIEAQATTTAPPAPHAGEPWRAMRFFGDPDAYYWLSYARDLRTSGHMRVRFTFADNAPFGREVHWAQLPIWSLAILSFVFEHAAGLPPPIALEMAGRLMMPLLGFVFFSVLLILLARRWGPFIALLTVLPLAPTCHYEFHPLRPDHHGFQIAFAIGCLVFLLRSGLGWVRQQPSVAPIPGDPLRPLSEARRNFILSGFFAGMALWLGATVFAFVLGAIAAGVAFSLLWTAPPATPGGATLRPDLFRWWGAAGAASSLIFYLLEYAPHHFSMRLEVNHPLYALWFLGTAECLRALARWNLDRSTFGPRDGLSAAAGFMAAGSLPLIVLVGPPAWYLPRSLLMLRLHARYITEFMSPLNSLAFSVYARDPLLLVGLVTMAVALFLLRNKRAPFLYRPALQTLTVATGLMFLLFGWQGRWLQFLPPFIFLLAGYCLAAMRHSRPSGSANSFVQPLPLLLALTLLIQTGLAARVHLHLIYKALRVEQLDALWNRYMLQRNMLLHLKAKAGGNSLRLIPPVEMAPAVYYFGVGDSIGSLYWENHDGLAAASEFMADPLPATRSQAIAQERSLTHILSLRIPDEAYMYHHLLTGTDNPAGRASTLGYVLSTGGPGIPRWATPDYPLQLAATKPLHVYVPAAARWIPLKADGRIYRLQP